MPSSKLKRTFQRVRRETIFQTASSDTLASQMYAACVAAAFSKCVDYNVLVNAERRHEPDYFVVLAGLRGICEDLIVLSFIGRFAPQARESYIKLRLSLDRGEGIRAQRNFFASNNPFQPVVGNKLSAEEASLHVAEARQALRRFWKDQSAAKKDGPNIRDMAEQVGLTSTYEYIYFAASNFLHFNPHALMRTGWGNEEGPFVFGTGNFSRYYKDLSRFYAACIYLGFCSSFARYLGQDKRVLRASTVEELLEDFQRWPELVTFEELNLKPPLFLFMHAMKQVARGDPANEGQFDALLHELKGLSEISAS